eukprot:SAG11_NODE_6139_length_1380_cov_2.024200_2_plen_106_part_01
MPDGGFVEANVGLDWGLAQRFQVARFPYLLVFNRALNTSWEYRGNIDALAMASCMRRLLRKSSAETEIVQVKTIADAMRLIEEAPALVLFVFTYPPLRLPRLRSRT